MCPRRPVISAVYRAEENDERAEDRSSLPEPIFYGGTLPTFSRVSLSGFISRARTLSLSLSRVCTRAHVYLEDEHNTRAVARDTQPAREVVGRMVDFI